MAGNGKEATKPNPDQHHPEKNLPTYFLLSPLQKKSAFGEREKKNFQCR